MNIDSFITEKEYQDLLYWIDGQFDLQVKPKSDAGKKLKIALSLVKQYEDINHVIPTEDSNINF